MARIHLRSTLHGQLSQVVLAFKLNALKAEIEIQLFNKLLGL